MINKIAIIGLGAMGASFARYALPLCQTVLVYDNQQMQIETLYSRMLQDCNPYDLHPGYIDVALYTKKVKACTTLAEIQREKPELTIICTHKETHCEITLAMLSAGSHVLVEKPIACNLTEARKMHEASVANQRFLFVEFCLHKCPEFEYLATFINKRNEIYPIKYQAQRISEIKDPESLNLTAAFDMQVHDVDYCLQTFGRPAKIEKQVHDPRYSKMNWYYPDGLQVDLFAKFTAKHTIPFEYNFKCDFSDGSSLSFASAKNTNNFSIEKINSNGTKEDIKLESVSAYQRVIQEVVSVVSSKNYHELATHPLMSSHAISALQLIE